MARPERIRLGDLLIQEALLTAAQLQQALAEQKKLIAWWQGVTGIQ